MFCLLVTVTGWYRTKRPNHCGHFWSIVRPHLSSNTPDSSTSALWLHQRQLSSSEAASWREISLNLAGVVSLTMKDPLTCRKNLVTWGRRFSSPPNGRGGVLRITSPVKMWTRVPWIEWQATNHYTIEATAWCLGKR